ncbi:MAG TPA: hypothetical protein VIW68_14200 [Candidatus Sulfotelmatobacter sp.]
MFEPHSLLWHYLMAAPSALLLVVAAIFYHRRLHRRLPAFLAFAVAEGVIVLALYAIDLLPFFSGTFWWQADCVHLVIEVILKFALIGEIFFCVFQQYGAVSQLGRTMIRGVGAALVLTAAVLAGAAHTGNTIRLVSGAHLLNLADFTIECGLLVFIFLFTAYFRLAWERLAFGIALGRGIAASVQLSTWAFLANVNLSNSTRHLIDLVNMSAYHVCVLIWLYYVLTTPKWTPKATRYDPDHRLVAYSMVEDERQKNLDVWNRELERLLQR